MVTATKINHYKKGNSRRYVIEPTLKKGVEARKIEVKPSRVKGKDAIFGERKDK